MKKESPLPKNVFYDINKFPKGYGLLVFPISISRMKEGQSPDDCLSFIKHFSPSKISEPKVGLQLIYSDTLYLHSKENASVLKHKNMFSIINHKNNFKKLLDKHKTEFQIQDAFSFQVWAELYLSYEGDFANDFKKIKDLYEIDNNFQKYIKGDAEQQGRDLTEEQLGFYLEEHLMFYLVTKGAVRFPNKFIQGREEWILACYPGAPVKGHVYLTILNPFKLSNPKNPYENCMYDLESKKLIDFTRIDLDTYNYKYE
jgi:hypothetical protein